MVRCTGALEDQVNTVFCECGYTIKYCIILVLEGDEEKCNDRLKENNKGMRYRKKYQTRTRRMPRKWFVYLANQYTT